MNHLIITKLIGVFALLFINAIGISAQTAEEIAVKEFSLDIAQKYCTNAFEIISNEDANSVNSWMDGVRDRIDFMRFSTNVHESLHGYDFDLADYSESAYFIDKELIIKVPESEVFHTADLHPNYYPSNVRETFRYGTYIFNDSTSRHFKGGFGMPHGPAFASSNDSGIFGLLEEFNAYYHGNRALYELVLAMDNDPEESGFDQERAEASMMTQYGGSAYYEFNSYLGYYLMYAKQYEPSVYSELMSNRELRTAYTMIETNWRDLLTIVYQDERLDRYFSPNDNGDDIFSQDARQMMSDFMISPSDLSQYNAFFEPRVYDPSIISDKRNALETKQKEQEAMFSSFDEALDDNGSSISSMSGLMDGPLDSITLNDVEFKIGSKERGQFYLVIAVLDDAFGLWDYLDVKTNNKDSGVYWQDGKYYLYLSKASNQSDAESILQKHKSQYPDLAIY